MPPYRLVDEIIHLKEGFEMSENTEKAHSCAKRLFNLLGPAVTDMAKLMDIITNTEMSKKRRAREIAKLVPITNITGGSREATADLIEEILP